jgi:hypothetical protein
VPAGSYLVALTVDGQTLKQELTVEVDPDYGAAPLTENGVEFLEELAAETEEEEHDDGGPVID